MNNYHIIDANRKDIPSDLREKINEVIRTYEMNEFFNAEIKNGFLDDIDLKANPRFTDYNPYKTLHPKEQMRRYSLEIEFLQKYYESDKVTRSSETRDQFIDKECRKRIINLSTEELKSLFNGD